MTTLTEMAGVIRRGCRHRLASDALPCADCLELAEAVEYALQNARQLRAAAPAEGLSEPAKFHFHSKRCYATGPGDTEVLICGLSETPREKDPIKRLHNLVDSLQRCDRCEAEIGDGDTTVLCEKCAAPAEGLGPERLRALARTIERVIARGPFGDLRAADALDLSEASAVLNALAAAPAAGEGTDTPEADYDWRRFCVNHEGYSGPTHKCPTCQEKAR